MICKEFFDHIRPLMNYTVIEHTWLKEKSEPICKKYKLKLSEYLVLLLLHVNSDVKTAKDIEKFSDMKRANISILVEILCKKGFLKQELIENDRRMKELIMTDACKPLMDETDELLNFLVSNVFKNIEKKDFEICERVFSQMYLNLIETTKK